MRIKISTLTSLAVLFPAKIALAGGFYKIIPYWLEYIYHLLLLGLIAVGFIACFSVYRTLKGGKLGKSWLVILIAFTMIFARTVLGTLTIFDIAYFQALIFAGLDVLFYIFLVIGLILYKIGLD